MGTPLAVLHIEDVEDDHLLVLRALKQGGYDVQATRCERAEELRLALASQPWDILLCDHKLPHFDSFGALQVLRESGLDLPLIIVSGSIPAEAAVEAMRLGARDFLFKSGLDRLVPAIQRELNEADGRRARKRAERDLAQERGLLRALTDNIPDTIYFKDPDGRFILINKAQSRLFGLNDPEEAVGKTDFDFFAKVHAERSRENERAILQGGQSMLAQEEELTFPDGHVGWVSTTKMPLADQAGAIVGTFGISRDITERKHAERRYRLLFEEAPASYVVTRLVEGQPVIEDCNDLFCQTVDYPRQDVLSRPLADFYSPASRSALLEGRGYERSLAGPMLTEERELVRRGGQVVSTLMHARPEADANGKAYGARAMYVDITERKQAEARIQLQLEHISALSAIDRVIASYFDLSLSLAEILTHVTRELRVDAADFLILNPSSQMLEFHSGHGFRTRALRKTRLRLGEGHAGRAALERQVVQVPDLRADPGEAPFAADLQGEGFVSYFGVPLLAKGQVKGVLEVFHRTPLQPDAEWLDFLKALGGQSAIAVDNSTLFEGLQRSNTELSLAYDATIEGWSRALDLRDEETEGHTQRVTAMTGKVARLFGLSEPELIQVRWGSLLHDIGKLGVPDKILLKPGPLTDEEWVTMKKHPTFAYEMLSPIRYLRQALDIPYCHHEKWDGTGYPRGLKGEQIPINARIFAVNDVWDALISARPYRQAWTPEKAMGHIEGLAGTHFDPAVVKVFLQEVQHDGA